MRLRAKSFCLLLERDRHAVVDVDVGIVHRFEPGWEARRRKAVSGSKSRRQGASTR